MCRNRRAAKFTIRLQFKRPSGEKDAETAPQGQKTPVFAQNRGFMVTKKLILFVSGQH